MRRRLILMICCLSLFIVGIDGTGVNVALPSIRTELGASPSELQWVVDSYALVLASLLMFSGSMADRFGRRRTFQIGLITFGLGSLLCSTAATPELLIGARMLQAVGGSMLNPVAMSIITNTFIEPRERARAIGVWGGVIGLSMALGPVVGGGLIQLFDWRAIFWLNVPVAIAAVVLAGVFVPESRAPRARRFDPIGQLLMAILLVSLTFGIIEGRALGWTSAPILGCFAATVVALVSLVRYESRRGDPLLDPRFFRSIPFSAAVLCAILGFAAQGGFLYLNTLYLQSVRGLTPLQAGLMTLPMAAATAICAPISGRLVGSRGTRLPLTVAGVGIAVSGVLLLGLAVDTSYLYLAVAYLAFGVGFGTLNAPITNSAVSGMPRAQAGTAAAVASTSRQVGAALGVAIFGVVALSSGGEQIGPEFAAATHAAWLVMIGVGLALVALAAISTSARALRSAQEAARLLDPGEPF